MKIPRKDSPLRAGARLYVGLKQHLVTGPEQAHVKLWERVCEFGSIQLRGKPVQQRIEFLQYTPSSAPSDQFDRGLQTEE